MHRIREAIKERGYGMTSLSKEMGITRQALFAILKSPSYRSLTRISEILGVPIWQLFTTRDEVLGKQCESTNKSHCNAHSHV